MKTEGLVKIICRKNGKILGASIFSNSAPELIHQLLFMKLIKKPLYKYSYINSIFPSYSEIIRQPAKRSLMENSFSGIRTIIMSLFFKRKKIKFKYLFDFFVKLPIWENIPNEIMNYLKIYPNEKIFFKKKQRKSIRDKINKFIEKF